VGRAGKAGGRRGGPRGMRGVGCALLRREVGRGSWIGLHAPGGPARAGRAEVDRETELGGGEEGLGLFLYPAFL
jgi:hypothetical protein